MEQIIENIVYIIVSAITSLIVSTINKNKKTLTYEQIEAKAEAKKQKLITKLEKKNHIPKVETVAESTTEVTNQNTNEGVY